MEMSRIRKNSKQSTVLRIDHYRWLILKWLIILIVITLSVFILVVTWIFFTLYIDKAFQSQPVNLKPSLINLSPTPNPTASWKSYTNIKYEYSIKYPSNWDIENADIARPEIVTFIKQPSGKDIDIHPQTVRIIVEPNPQINTPTIKWYKNEWAKQIPAGINFDNVKFEETTFQGLPALKANNAIFFARGLHMFRAEWAVIDFGNADTKLIELTKQTYNQILSTFEFLDQDTPETGLDTY